MRPFATAAAIHRARCATVGVHPTSRGYSAATQVDVEPPPNRVTHSPDAYSRAASLATVSLRCSICDDQLASAAELGARCSTAWYVRVTCAWADAGEAPTASTNDDRVARPVARAPVQRMSNEAPGGESSRSWWTAWTFFDHSVGVAAPAGVGTCAASVSTASARQAVNRQAARVGAVRGVVGQIRRRTRREPTARSSVKRPDSSARR